MVKLFNVLTNFVNEVNSNVEIEKLEDKFNELARVFLYGGYIKVRDDYRIYIRTVEFYFHSEKDGVGIKDPIVYHRNNRNIDGKIPYFPKMFLHAHPSGFDITFEKDDEYRASALIRAYEVWDIHKKCHLIYDKSIQKFRIRKENESKLNTQSTYLYTLLNGFSIREDHKDNEIMWVDDSEEKQLNDCAIKPKPKMRKNVPMYRKVKEDFEKVTKEYYENNKEEFSKQIKEYCKKHKEEYPEQTFKPKYVTYKGVQYLLDYKLWQFERKDN